MEQSDFLTTVYSKLSAGRQSEGHSDKAQQDIVHIKRACTCVISTDNEISRRPLRGGLSAVGTRMPAASRGAVLRLRQLPYRRLPTFPFTDSRAEGPGASLGRQGSLWGKALGNLSVELSKSSQSGGLSPHPPISRGNHAEPTRGIFIGENVRSGRTRWGRCGQLLIVA